MTQRNHPGTNLLGNVTSLCCTSWHDSHICTLSGKWWIILYFFIILFFVVLLYALYLEYNAQESSRHNET